MVPSLATDEIYSSVIVIARVRSRVWSVRGAAGMISNRSHQVSSLSAWQQQGDAKSPETFEPKHLTPIADTSTYRWLNCCVDSSPASIDRYNQTLGERPTSSPLKSNGLLEISSASQLKTFQLFVDGWKVKKDYLNQFLNDCKNSVLFNRDPIRFILKVGLKIFPVWHGLRMAGMDQYNHNLTITF